MVLVIRSEQVNAFEEKMVERFEGKMFQHFKVYAPKKYALIGDKNLQNGIKSAIKSGLAAKFVTERGLQLIIELSIVLGSGFHTDPQYPRAAEIFQYNTENQAIEDLEFHTSNALHKVYSDYNKLVLGENKENWHNALRNFAFFVNEDGPVYSYEKVDLSASDFAYSIFPEKIAELGDGSFWQDTKKQFAMFNPHDRKVQKIIKITYMLKLFCGKQCTNDHFHPYFSLPNSDYDKLLASLVSAVNVWINSELNNL